MSGSDFIAQSLGEFELLTLGLITYHPEGKQVNVRKVEENSKTTDKVLVLN